MKHLFIFFMFFMGQYLYAQKVVIDGVIYQVDKRNNNMYIAAINKELTTARITGKISYSGREYDVKALKTVSGQSFSSENNPLLRVIIMDSLFSEIPEYFFSGASQVERIILPNSIENIRTGAFFHCKNLDSLIIPNSVRTIEDNAFSGCQSLKTIKGLRHNIKYEDYSFVNCSFPFEEYKKNFIIHRYIYDKIKEWGQKKEFETTAQYQARVTKENLKKREHELISEAIKKYTEDNKPAVSLGKYDADNQFFILYSNYGTHYVKVPFADAQLFKSNFEKAPKDIDYVLTPEGIKICDLIIDMDGVKYNIEKGSVLLASSTIDFDVPEANLNDLLKQQTVLNPKPVVVADRSVDTNIPIEKNTNNDCFAVIIGNEQYQQVINVPFANNDALIFAEYCKKVLGMPERNVKLYNNATFGTMIRVVSDIQKITKAFKGNVNIIFYYAGHGIPNEATGDAYLLPVDADGKNAEVCYPLNRLYKELGEMGANRVTIFMDACFSGAERGNGMIAEARGVAIKAKNGKPAGNTVVISAATGAQTAFPYTEKGHGMFTYFLLKKLQETKGDVTLGELGDYICDETAKQAILINGKEQTPVILTSQGILNDWKKWKLK